MEGEGKVRGKRKEEGRGKGSERGDNRKGRGMKNGGIRNGEDENWKGGEIKLVATLYTPAFIFVKPAAWNVSSDLSKLPVDYHLRHDF